MKSRYELSEQFLQQALNVIPLGSQTFSKSITQLPVGAAPLFVDKAKGAKFWDIDGNEYVDFCNSLLAVSLGYQDPDVDAAVKKQMDSGVTFSLPHRLETEVAELICDAVPCAEMVRFGKNGSDVTAGAIRVARAYTKRDHVIVCGYHGWQDWYIASTTKDAGVPSCTKKLVHHFKYNDIESLKAVFDEHKNQIAAVIMEPMNTEHPKPGFLENVKTITHENGALLIFDEMITGFRFDLGGAQKLFGVIPDLATFGKGLANGYPLAALVGKKEFMLLLNEVFFSFTFGGETLSLAAAKATITKLKEQPVLQHIKKLGIKLHSELNKFIIENKLTDIVSILGDPIWSFIILKDYKNYSAYELKTYWLQELFARGFYSIGTNNISFAHTETDVMNFIAAQQEILTNIKLHCENGNLIEQLKCKPLKPLFKVR